MLAGACAAGNLPLAAWLRGSDVAAPWPPAPFAVGDEPGEVHVWPAHALRWAIRAGQPWVRALATVERCIQTLLVYRLRALSVTRSLALLES
jgi:hypothetical protein